MSKIAIVGSAYPLRGGLAAYNERLAREFQAQGHTVKIFTFSLQYPSILFPGKSQYSESPAPADLDIEVCLNSVNPLSWIKTGKKIRDFGADILIFKYWLPFMGPAFGTVARIARKGGKMKVISLLDNVIPHESRPGDKPFTNYFLKPVDGFIAMSESVLNDLRKFDPESPVKLIPHPLYDHFGVDEGITASREKLGIDHNGPLVLFFGFIRDYKGLDILIEAMSFLKGTGIKALVAGEFYTDSAPYLELIKKHQLEDSIYLHTDFIPDEKVSLFFSAAELVVQPYKSATQSGVTQIAYHFNKPMVVTDVGGLAEMVPDGKAGFVTPPEAEKVAQAIKSFYEGDVNRFQSHILELKKQYSWKRMVDGIMELSGQ